MVVRRPLVIYSGAISELLAGDTVTAGTITSQVAAGSGLTGGGTFSSDPRLDVALVSNPSGVIFVGDAIGLDGSDLVTANTALSSGSEAAYIASSGLNVSNQALGVASEALASGNAALEIIPTLGGASNQATFIAAGPISSGHVVGFDDTNRVQALSTIFQENFNPLVFPESPAVFDVGGTQNIANTFDSVNNKVVISYEDTLSGPDFGTAVVATVQNNTVTYGTPVVFSSNDTNLTKITFDPDTAQVVIAYRDSTDSNYGKCIVGSVSGTTVSFGTPVVFQSLSTTNFGLTYDTVNNKIFLPYRVSNTQLDARVGTVGSLSISFGTAATLETPTAIASVNTVYDSSNQYCVYAYDNSTVDGRIGIAEITGTNVALVDTTAFYTGNVVDLSLAFDTAENLVIIAYEDNVNGSIVSADCSGGTISLNTPTTFIATAINGPSIVYDPIANKTAVFYYDTVQASGFALAAQTSGTTFGIYPPTVFASGVPVFEQVNATYDSYNNRVVCSYRNSTYNNGESVVPSGLLEVIRVPSLSGFQNALGISQSTTSSGSACLVNLPGALYEDTSASLTTGAFYYPDPLTSGITTQSQAPSFWRGQVEWSHIARAVSSSGLLLLDCL